MSLQDEESVNYVKFIRFRCPVGRLEEMVKSKSEDLPVCDTYYLRSTGDYE